MTSLQARPGSGPPWRWAVGGVLLGLALALFFYAPALWLTGVIEDLSMGRVLFGEVRGTVWNGSAQLTLSGGALSRDAATLPGRVQWRLRPSWGGVNAELSASCCTTQPLQFELTPRWSGVRLSLGDGGSQWPAAVLAGLGTPWNTLAPQGQLAVWTRGLTLHLASGRATVEGQAQIQARDLSSRVSTLRPLGSYQLTLQGSQGGADAKLELETLDGPLRLTGQGHWSGARLHFEGAASAAPGSLEALSNLLNIIGQRQGALSIISLG